MARGRPSGTPTRRTSRSEVLPELLALVEGARTEESYFVYWHRRNRRRVRVKIDEFHGGPVQLVERAVRAKKQGQREERRGRGRAYDEIWCVFDVDEHPHLPDAIQRATDNGIKVAVSNPCIELWFILHYEDQTAHIERRSAQAQAQALLQCSKALTQEAFNAMADRYDDAVRRAKFLDKKHRDDGSPSRANPSSEVWRLVDRIRLPSFE